MGLFRRLFSRRSALSKDEDQEFKFQKFLDLELYPDGLSSGRMDGGISDCIYIDREGCDLTRSIPSTSTSTTTNSRNTTDGGSDSVRGDNKVDGSNWVVLDEEIEGVLRVIILELNRIIGQREELRSRLKSKQDCYRRVKRRLDLISHFKSYKPIKIIYNH